MTNNAKLEIFLETIKTKAVEKSFALKGKLTEIIRDRYDVPIQTTSDKLDELEREINNQLEAFEIVLSSVPGFQPTYNTVKELNEKTLDTIRKYRPTDSDIISLPIQLLICEKLGLLKSEVLSNFSTSSQVGNFLAPILRRNSNDIRKLIAVNDNEVIIASKVSTKFSSKAEEWINSNLPKPKG